MTAENRIAMYAGPKGLMTREVGGFLLGNDVPLATVDDKDIERGKLSDYPAVVFPGGWGPVISKKAEKNLKSYIRGGGGCICICASVCFAHELGLLDFDLIDARGIGWYYINVLKRHPVTKGYHLANKSKPRQPWGSDTIRISRVNGDFIVPGKGTTVLVGYDRKGKLGAVAAGKLGKGDVVLFSAHPELGVEPPPEWEWRDWQDPGKLLLNAVDFVSGKAPRKKN